MRPTFNPHARALYGGPPRIGEGRAADPEVAERIDDMESAIKPERRDDFARVGVALTGILTILGPLNADERRRVLAAVAAAVTP